MRTNYVLLGFVTASCFAGCAAEVAIEPSEDVDVIAEALVSTDAHTERVEGDFNNDGSGDFIVVNGNGSFQYLGRDTGGFVADQWIRNDLTTSTAQYAVGDFNCDKHSDLIIVTSAGSFEYLGQDGGGFVENAWSNPNLKRNAVRYTVGNFNGDQCDDLIVTTGTNSTQLLGRPDRGFDTNSWLGPWTMSSSKFNVGDFNGDGPADLLVTTRDGTSEYLGSKTTVGFFASVWTRSDLKLNEVMYTVGKFDGTSAVDLIITTSLGSFEYFGRTGASGGFTPGSWTRSDLTLFSVNFTTGQFDGDSFGTTDLIITTDTGSFEYAGLTGGGFTPDVWKDTSSPFRRSSVWFFSSDFNRDGRTDVLAMRSTLATEYLGRNGGGFSKNWTSPNLPSSTTRLY